MRAVIRRNKQLVCDEIAELEPEAGQVLVRTLACGICGSDLHALHHMEHMIELGRRAAHFGAPPLVLTEKVDSPLYRVGAGVELNGVNGVGLAVRYNGAFGEKVEMNAVSAALKVRF